MEPLEWLWVRQPKDSRESARNSDPSKVTATACEETLLRGLQMPSLKSLIAELEQAKKGSRKLDREIQLNVVGFDPDQLPKRWPVVGNSDPRYTTSLDAALTLVPEGLSWHVWSLGSGLPSAEVKREGEPPHYGLLGSDVREPALALCIASLRARDNECS